MEKKHIGKIIALMVLMFASSFGQTIETLARANVDYDTATGYGFLITTANMLLISVVMMVIPFICRLVNKDKLPHKKGKRICLWNSIVLFVLSSLMLAVIETGFIGGVGAVIFYFINKWVFVHQYEVEDKTAYVSDDSLLTQEHEQPFRVCLSPEGEEPQSRGSFDIYGADIKLKTDGGKQETQPNKQSEQPSSPANQQRVKYCSRCGSAINPATKRCTGCSKQYFKGISFKSFCVVLLIALLGVSITGNVLLSAENKSLQNEKKGLENDVSYLASKYNEYWNETNAKMDLFDSWIVFIENDGTKLYHKYECNKFIGKDCWAHNVEYAEYIGYNPCPRCCD